jgi:hypothetical protein
LAGLAGAFATGFAVGFFTSGFLAGGVFDAGLATGFFTAFFAAMIYCFYYVLIRWGRILDCANASGRGSLAVQILGCKGKSDFGGK